jgi:hypothetical protein
MAPVKAFPKDSIHYELPAQALKTKGSRQKNPANVWKPVGKIPAAKNNLLNEI